MDQTRIFEVGMVACVLGALHVQFVLVSHGILEKIFILECLQPLLVRYRVVDGVEGVE